ncbi:hypothetical protein ACVWZV_004740 [Bradyrhizobium sp. GM5.1]
MHGEGEDLGAARDHRDVERPQLQIACGGDGDHAGADYEHQRGPGITCSRHIFRNGLDDDRRHVAQHPAPLEHDGADREMRDRGLCEHEAGIVGQQRDRAEHDDERDARIGHVIELLPLDARVDHLRDRSGNRHRRCQDDVVGDDVDDQEDDGREEVGGEGGRIRPSSSILFSGSWTLGRPAHRT